MGVAVKRYIDYRYPHNNYYFSLLYILVLGSSIPTSLFILKDVFSF